MYFCPHFYEMFHLDTNATLYISIPMPLCTYRYRCHFLHLDTDAAKNDNISMVSSSFQKSSSSYASVVAECVCPGNLQAAEELGTNLASDMLEDGAEEILLATKKQMAAEIAREKVERDAKKAAAEKGVPPS